MEAKSSLFSVVLLLYLVTASIHSSCDASLTRITAVSMKCWATLDVYFWRFTVKIRKNMWVSHFHWVVWCKWTRLHVERLDHRMAPGDPEYIRSICWKRRRDDGAAWRQGKKKKKSEQKRQRNGERISGNIVMNGWFFYFFFACCVSRQTC